MDPFTNTLLWRLLAIHNEHHAIGGRIVNSISLEIRGSVPHIFIWAVRNMENITILDPSYLFVEA